MIDRNWGNPPYYLTAYGLAVKHGFTGSEREWLESLHGQNACWLYGTALSGTAEQTVSVPDSGLGDMYLNTETGDVYRQEREGVWSYVGCIRGATGATGDTGADGYGVLPVANLATSTTSGGGHIYEVSLGSDYTALPDAFMMGFYLSYGLTAADKIRLYGNGLLWESAAATVTPSTLAAGYHLFAYDGGKLYEIAAKGDKGDRGEKGDKGELGEKGETGETGAAGAAGQDGADGTDGADGYGVLPVANLATSTTSGGGHIYEVSLGTDYTALPDAFMVGFYLSYGLTAADKIRLYGNGLLWESAAATVTPSTLAAGYHLFAYDGGKLYEIAAKGDKGDRGEKGDKGEPGNLAAGVGGIDCGVWDEADDLSADTFELDFGTF